MKEMTDEQLANKLLCALSAETLFKAELFDYLCWLELKHQEEAPDLVGKDFLVLASDGTTCWGKSYPDAVEVAMNHDKGIFDAENNPA